MTVESIWKSRIHDQFYLSLATNIISIYMNIVFIVVIQRESNADV